MSAAPSPLQPDPRPADPAWQPGPDALVVEIPWSSRLTALAVMAGSLGMLWLLARPPFSAAPLKPLLAGVAAALAAAGFLGLGWRRAERLDLGSGRRIVRTGFLFWCREREERWPARDR